MRDQRLETPERNRDRDGERVKRLAIYSRPGCHLCDDMKALVRKVTADVPSRTSVEEIDITDDPALERLYGLEVPVLLIDGRKAAKFLITEIDLRRKLKMQAP